MYTDWHSLGEILYRKFEISPMAWREDQTFEINKYHVCGAPFGGPIAIIKDFVPKGGGASKSDYESKLQIYTSSGKALADVPLANKKLAGSGWSDQEILVLVLEDGNVVMYDIHGNEIRNFPLANSTLDIRLLECHFWGNGVVAIDSNMDLYVAEGFSSTDVLSNLRKYTLKTHLQIDRPYTAMAIVPPLLSRSGLLEVMLGTQDNSVLVVDENDVEDQLLQDRIGSPITKIAVAPNGRFLACYRKDGVLTVMSATFTTKVLDFDTKSVSKPLEIAWCGEDAVLLMWKNTGIVMVGPYGDWLNFSYDEDVFLVAESDCCRIITASSCEMLQRVPSSTEAIRRIGSTDPAALLFDAMEAFEDGDPKSDENIRSIAATNQLGDAVQSCITAAAAEFDISRQQALMKAASYGKAFCADADPMEFVDTACKLRVLNAVRLPEIGLPLTIQQYNRLTPEVLVNRLTIRNHHFLALRICELLKLKNDRVLVHWASEKVKKLALNNASDEVIRDTIKKKLDSFGRVSYLNVADSAHRMGRRRLATMILDMEPHAADQVPLLLQMQEEELALQKAINSEDTDLIYLTLIHLERSRTDKESFYRLVHSHIEAANLLKMYYRHRITVSDRLLLHNLLMYGKNYMEAGMCAVNQAYMQPSVTNKLQLIKEASGLFNQSRDLAFQKSMTDEQIDLMEIQKALELRSHRDFMDLSLSETIYNLVLLCIEFPTEVSRWDQEILKLVKKFKISEKMVWSIKIQCFSKTGQWALLKLLAAEKKSPLGYKPFARACIKFKQPVGETERYIDKIVTPEDRFELFVEVQLWKKAIEVAVKMKDPARLEEVGRTCKDSSIERQVQEYLSKM